MDNPFEILNSRLTNIEDLLLSIKHEKVKPVPDHKPQNEEILLDKREAGKLLNCSVSTIDAMRRNGSLQPIYIGGRRGAVRFKRSQVLELIRGK